MIEMTIYDMPSPARKGDVFQWENGKWIRIIDIDDAQKLCDNESSKPSSA